MKKKTDIEFTHKFGKMIKGKSSLLLDEGQLTDTQNMLPGYEWEQRKGMVALTASAVATGLRFKSLCQFRDLRGDTDVLLAHTYDSVGGEDLYVGDALPPSAIAWTKKYDLTAGCTKCQFANVAKAVIVANSKDFLIWRGNVNFPTAVWKYNSASTSFTLFADEMFDSDDNTVMALDGLNTDEFIYVLSDMPLDTINIVMGDLNAVICAMDVEDFNGTWNSVASLDDQTETGGDTPFGVSGAIKWTPGGDEVQTTIESVPGFAYRISFSEVLTNPTSVTGISVHAPLGTVANIWNNRQVPPTGCYVLSGGVHTDYMAYINNTVESQYLDLSLVDEGDKIYFGFPQRVNKILIWMAADGQNTNNVSLTSIKYFDQAGAPITVGTIVDTTETATEMFSQKGYFSWVAPAEYLEKRTIIAGDEIPMFWYEVIVDDELVDPTYVYYVQGVPVTESIDPARGVFAYKRRCWQIAPRNHENKVRYSAQDLPNTFNGHDSGYIAFGERPLARAAPFYNETLLFADTELWMLQGNSPTNFGRIRLSAKIGTNSAESVVNIESGVIVADSLKVVVAWQFFDGFWMFDGVRVWKISAPDIDSFFDPDHEDYIPHAYLDQTVGEYDYATQTVRWSVYSGAGATSPTKVIVMHFPTLNYGIFDYATDIDAMLSVVNDKYYLVAGGHADGRFYQLDTGLTDLLNTTATAVDAFVITRDEFIGYSEGTRQRLLSVWFEAQEAGGQLELDEYPDGSKTPQNIAKTNMTVKGKLFGAIQRTLKLFAGQKTTKFRIRNRSKNARMKLLGTSTTVDKDRANE
jgi:hypothetical protein